MAWNMRAALVEGPSVPGPSQVSLHSPVTTETHQGSWFPHL